MNTCTTLQRDENALRNKQQAARYLGISKASLQRLIAQRKLRYIRVGSLVKIDPRELERFCEENEGA
jgi:excisionase family DNA binding protein